MFSVDCGMFYTLFYELVARSSCVTCRINVNPTVEIRCIENLVQSMYCEKPIHAVIHILCIKNINVLRLYICEIIKFTLNIYAS